MNLRRVLLLAILAVSLLLAAAWWWTLHTTSGARFVWARVQGAIGDRIAIGHIDGDIANGLAISDFRWDDSGVRVEVGRFAGRVDVGFRPLAISLDGAEAGQVSVVVRRDPSPGPRRGLEERLRSLVLPFDLHVGGLNVRDLLVSPGESARDIRITRTELAGSWTERVVIEHLRVQQGDRRAALQGTLDLHGDGPLAAELHLVAGPGLLPRIDSVDAEARLDGNLRGFRFRAAGDVLVQQFGEFRVRGEGDGNFGALEIVNARAVGDAAAGEVAGEIAWSDGFRTELAIELERFALSSLVDTWPEQHTVGGALNLQFASPAVEIRDAALTIAGTNGRVSGSLSADLDTEQIDADLEWQALEWPVGAALPRLSSESGEARLSGRFDEWHAEGTVALSSPDLPSGRFTVEAKGNRSSAEGRIVEGDILGGTLHGTAAAAWDGPPSFAADLDLRDVRTDVLWPEWPGSVSGRIDVTGTADPLRFEARLDGIRGRLRGWPLAADGQVAVRKDGLSARSFVLRHGESELRLDGGMQQDEGVRFTGHLADLGSYVDGIAGDLDATGRLAMREGEPALEAEIRSDRLTVGKRELAETVLTVEGTRAFQAVEFRTLLDEQRLRVSASGVPDDPQAPTAWDGTLTRFSLQQEDDGGRREIHLVASAPLRVSGKAVSLDRACLQGSIEARLCLELDWMAGTRLGIVADLDSIAVDRVNQFVNTGFVFDQHVTGQMRWEKAAGKPLTASAALTISPGTLRNELHEDTVVRTGEGSITFEVRDGALLEGRMNLPMPGTGSIGGEFSMADIGNLDESRIGGHVDAVLTDISPLRMFLPTVNRADGRLTANVVIEGTVRAPFLTGDVSLDDGLIEYRPLGLVLDDIQLDATFDERRHFQLAGEFRAGDGRGTLASSGEYGNGGAEDLVVNVRGDRLRLIDVPDLEAVANADVRVGFDKGVIRIDGKLGVPHARISPRSLPATRYSESEDVVIIAGKLPVEEVANQRPTVTLAGRLEVGLGDDVVVDIDLAEAKVTGNVVFEWNDELIPTANGRYDISGDVQAYGQVLTITEGAIRFPKVPANNPFLRIRAEREIFGNSQIKSAGILIGGTVKRPTVEPYTDPRTTRERALTLLVTGSDFDLEQGVGAIDFGTYIAPRLFVSYGIGLFDQENVISARYDLGKGFGVKATSGQKESGIDLMYHVER